MLDLLCQISFVGQMEAANLFVNYVGTECLTLQEPLLLQFLHLRLVRQQPFLAYMLYQ